MTQRPTELFKKYVNPPAHRRHTEHVESDPSVNIRELFKDAPAVIPDCSNYFLLPQRGELRRVRM